MGDRDSTGTALEFDQENNHNNKQHKRKHNKTNNMVCQVWSGLALFELDRATKSGLARLPSG